jgi:chemotaxis protein CheX
MMGRMPVESLDAMAKSALGELGNLLAASAVLKLNNPVPIQISPPTVVLGERLFLMISRVPSRVLQFRFDQDQMTVRVSVE